MSLVITLATRSRPSLVVDTIKTSIANWANKDTIMQVQLDHDDPASLEALTKAKLGDRVLLNVKEREDTIAAKWNRALELPADVYSVAADDDPYVTPGYDNKILEAAKRFPDGIGMVYGHMANLSFTCSLSMTKKMTEKLGYIQPEHFPYWFCDHWTDDVARIIGRISVADIRTDQSRAPETMERREIGFWTTFFDACFLKRRHEARKLIDDPEFVSPEWQKEILRTHHPLIEERSRTLNMFCRQQTPNSNLSLKEERYQRIKKRALDMLPELLADPEMSQGEIVAFKSILTPPTTITGLRRAYA